MQRSLDWLIALSLLFWGVAAVIGRDVNALRSPIVLSILVLNGAVAWLFIRREIPRHTASLWTQAAAIPSVLIGPLVFHRASDYIAWPWPTEVAFVVACSGVTVALLSLGSSFAIFPTIRTFVCRGPYRLIRHPAYAGELAMMLVAATMKIDWINGLLVALALAATVLRIVVEEQFLKFSMEGYRQYTQSVRSRLVPWVW